MGDSARNNLVDASPPLQLEVTLNPVGQDDSILSNHENESDLSIELTDLLQGEHRSAKPHQSSQQRRLQDLPDQLEELSKYSGPQMKVDFEQQFLVVGSEISKREALFASFDELFTDRAELQCIIEQLESRSMMESAPKKDKMEQKRKQVLLLEPNSFSSLALKTQLQMFGVESDTVFKADLAMELIHK